MAIVGFMQPEVVYGSWWLIVTQHCASTIIPRDLVTTNPNKPDFSLFEDYVSGRDQIMLVELITGKWGGRLSAPGYLDCTDWDLFDTEKEAINYLEETYGE